MLKRFLSASLSLIILTSIILINPLTIGASNFSFDRNLSISPNDDTLEFGDVNINSYEVEDFTISNNGPNQRHLQILRGPVYPFSLMSSPSFSLAPYSQSKLSFRFEPRTETDFEQEITIKEIFTNEVKTLTLTGSGDRDTSTTDSRRTAKVSYSSDEIAFSPDEDETLTFEDTVEGFSSEKTIYVTNNSNDRARVRVTDDPSRPFEVVGSSSKTVSEDEVEHFTIRFSPQNTRDYNDVIEFEVEAIDDDGDDYEEKIEINLRGEGIELDEDDDPFRFNLSSETINPEAGEKAYFNFETDTTARLEIEIFDDGDSIYEQNYTVSRGTKDLDYFWDGDNDNGRQVSDGTYNYVVKIENEDDDETYRGEIEVDTDVDFDLSSQRTVFVDGFPRYPFYDNNVPDDFDKITTNENLIFRLKASPDYVTSNNTDVKISLEATEDGRATVRLYNEDLQRLLTIDSSQRLREGYHKNEFTWENTEIRDEDARDGKYLIKVEFRSDDGDLDTDVVWVNLNRDGLLEDGQFDPPYPNYDNGFQEYYEEFEREFGYTPSCEGFADIPEESFTCAAALYAFDKGIFTGNNINNLVYLRPNEPMTRAEALAVVLRVMGVEITEYNAQYDGNLGFSDMSTKGWYAPYIKTMIKTARQAQARFGERTPSILNGYPDGTIKPNDEINRAEFFKIMIESAQSSENVRPNFNINYTPNQNPFQDVRSDQWFAPYAHFATKYLNNSRYAARYFGSYEISSNLGRFKGSQSISRGEVIDFIYELERQNLVQF